MRDNAGKLIVAKVQFNQSIHITDFRWYMPGQVVGTQIAAINPYYSIFRFENSPILGSGPFNLL
jgi:hypothetical protein